MVLGIVRDCLRTMDPGRPCVDAGIYRPPYPPSAIGNLHGLELRRADCVNRPHAQLLEGLADGDAVLRRIKSRFSATSATAEANHTVAIHLAGTRWRVTPEPDLREQNHTRNYISPKPTRDKQCLLPLWNYC